MGFAEFLPNSAEKTPQRKLWTVHGRSSIISVLLGEVGRIISPFVFDQVKANLSPTTTDSRTTLALATVHLIYTLKNGSVHLKWF